MITVKLIDGQLQFEPGDAIEEAAAAEACAEGRAPEILVTALSADACTDFDELWSAGRMTAGGTRATERDIFVMGAAYGMAWAMAHLLGSDGESVQFFQSE